MGWRLLNVNFHLTRKLQTERLYFLLASKNLCIFVVQMTMQLAALNGKDLMTEKHGTLWDKAAVAHFTFSSLTTISTPHLRTKIQIRELSNTKQARQSLTPAKTAYLIICNTISPVAYYSVYNLLYNRPHSTPNACKIYLRCRLPGATIDPVLAENVWSGPQH
jgi:hypothetical protein